MSLFPIQNADYVLIYSGTSREATKELLERLASAGMLVTAREIEGKLALAVYCPPSRLSIEDFLDGLRARDPFDDTAAASELTAAERLRLVHKILTDTEAHGGAHCLFDEASEWCIFPIHDSQYNKRWLQSWSRKWYLDNADLDDVRDQFGEKIAFYFEFLQQYFSWLSFPAVVGVLAWISNSAFSKWYAVLTMLWAVAFVEYWARRESEMAAWWGVRGFSHVDIRNPHFKGDEIIVDDVTGQKKEHFAMWKRWTRYAMTVPAVILLSLALAAAIGAIFAMEVFLTEFYQGPFREYLHFVPTIVYVAMVPVLNEAYSNIARRLTIFENHVHESEHVAHLTLKIVIMNFLLGYLSIFVIAFAYIPYSSKLESFVLRHSAVDVKHEPVGTGRLIDQVIYFVLTAQIINFATEVLVPWLSLKASAGAEKIKDKMQRASSRSSDTEVDANERVFLQRVAEEYRRPAYDDYADYAEMVVQFGHVALFSVVWPLVPVICFINNWFELRSDAAKIILTTRRPIPRRTETIGSWLQSMRALTWLASITNAALVFLFSDATHVNGLPWLQLVAMAVVAERLYGVSVSIFTAIFQLKSSAAETMARKQEFELKRKIATRAGVLGEFVKQVNGRDAVLAVAEKVFKTTSVKRKEQ